MYKDVENPMVNDDYWPSYESEDEDQETSWERFCRLADEEHDEDAADLVTRGLGYVNGYFL